MSSDTPTTPRHYGPRNPLQVDRTLANDSERTIAAIVETARDLGLDTFLSITETGNGSLPGWFRWCSAAYWSDDTYYIVGTSSTTLDDGSVANPRPICTVGYRNGDQQDRVSGDVSLAWEALVKVGAPIIAAHP